MENKKDVYSSVKTNFEIKQNSVLENFTFRAKNYLMTTVSCWCLGDDKLGSKGAICGKDCAQQ